MALHGPIQVNDHKIGHWCARRTQTLHHLDQTSIYECWVEINGVRTETFHIGHQYSEGALALMSMVLTHGSALWAKEHPDGF